MQQNYKAFIRRVIQKYEGGYGWDRNDPGGPTKYGITCYDLAEHLGRKMTSKTAWAPIVQSMGLETAEEIYAKKYAVKDRFADLANGADCVMLDFGINSGTLRPVWIAQQIYHRSKADVFDDRLLNAINFDTPAFIDKMCAARMTYLRGLRIWPTFKGGWTSRVTDLQNYAQDVYKAGQTPPEPDVVRPIVDQVAAVKRAQFQLNRYYALNPPLEVDGYCGPLTKAQVKRFQIETGIIADGIVGPQTLAKLEEVVPPVDKITTDVMPDYPVMARGEEEEEQI
jgi:lysozyme family protein